MEGFNKVKGKRTKRQRHHLLPQAVSSVFYPTTSSDITAMLTEEEKVLVNCLLLFSRGGYNPKPEEKEEATANVNITSGQSLAVPTAIISSKTENNVHKCGDCHRCFPSHQALGGHRASHNKKLKLSIPQPSEANNVNSSINSFSSPPTNKQKIHRCTKCSKEFNSGQALGGHMRKHYIRKEKDNSKRFDIYLNLPPPCDD